MIKRPTATVTVETLAETAESNRYTGSRISNYLSGTGN